MISNYIKPTVDWIKADYTESPIRFAFEVLAWLMSISCAVIMMITVPNPPFLLLYPMFITQCAIFAWAAWTRKSFGMLSNYMLLVSIDLVALWRLL